MAIELVYMLYEGPIDPNDPSDLRANILKPYYPDFIEIVSAYHNMSLTRNSVSLKHVNTSSLPRLIVENLEKAIVEQTGFNPMRKDMLFGTPQDLHPTFKFARRHLTYFSMDPEEKKGRPTKVQQQALLEMHRAIYPVYLQFLVDLKKNGKKNGSSSSQKAPTVKNGKH